MTCAQPGPLSYTYEGLKSTIKLLTDLVFLKEPFPVSCFLDGYLWLDTPMVERWFFPLVTLKNIFLNLFFIFLSFMHVPVYVWISCRYIFVNVEARGKLPVSSSGILSISFETETWKWSLDLEHTKKTRCTDQQAQRIFVSSLPWCMDFEAQTQVYTETLLGLEHTK